GLEAFGRQCGKDAALPASGLGGLPSALRAAGGADPARRDAAGDRLAAVPGGLRGGLHLCAVVLADAALSGLRPVEFRLPHTRFRRSLRGSGVERTALDAHLWGTGADCR